MPSGRFALNSASEESASEESEFASKGIKIKATATKVTNSSEVKTLNILLNIYTLLTVRPLHIKAEIESPLFPEKMRLTCHLKRGCRPLVQK